MTLDFRSRSRALTRWCSWCGAIPSGLNALGTVPAIVELCLPALVLLLLLAGNALEFFFELLKLALLLRGNIPRLIPPGL